MPRFYGVRRGRRTGVYDNWPSCSSKVHRYAGAEYKGFDTEAEAQAYVNDYLDLSPLTSPELGAAKFRRNTSRRARIISQIRRDRREQDINIITRTLCDMVLGDAVYIVRTETGFTFEKTEPRVDDEPSGDVLSVEDDF
ncbi:hypothetical protein ACHAPA_005519 [Fusarium lateritium]